MKSFKDSGGDGKVLILLPGFPASLKYWASTQRFLVKLGYRVIPIDLLGLGAAPKPKDIDYTYEDHIEYVHRMIEEFGIGTKLTLIGHSMGALLAARYAINYPNSVDKIILLNPPLYIDSSEAYATLRNTGRLYRLMLDSKFRGIAWMFARRLSLGLIANHTKISRDRSLEQIIESAELFDDLQRIDVPTLLLIGTKDRPQYLRNVSMQTFKDNIQLEIEDVSHHSAIFYKELVRSLILSFLNK